MKEIIIHIREVNGKIGHRVAKNFPEDAKSIADFIGRLEIIKHEELEKLINNEQVENKKEDGEERS